VAQKFITPITIRQLASAGSDALTVFVDGEVYGRVKIEAGGRISWSNGEGAYDTNLYRDGVNTLATDDVLKAISGVVTMSVEGVPTATLPDGAIAVDTLNDTFYFRSSGEWTEVSASGASLTVSETPPTGELTEGNLWYESDTGKTFVYYDSFWVEVGTSGNPIPIEDISGNSATATKLQTPRTISLTGGVSGSASFDGSQNISISSTVNHSAINTDILPSVDNTHSLGSSSLRWQDVYVGPGSLYVQDAVTNENVAITVANGLINIDGQPLVANNEVQNNSVTLGTHTTGNYVASLVAGTGINLTNNSGENATPTIAVDTTAIQARVSNVSDTEISYLDGVTSGIQGQLDNKAPLASPALTGTPTAPTASVTTNTTQIATTAFVRTEIANLVASAPAALDTLDELAAALGDDANFAATTATAIGLKAPLASPTFTGTVTVPTPLNNTDAATKIYVDSAQTSAQTYADSLTYSLSDLTDGITASGAEINILDGVTASTSEINILDGITSSTTELNILDGATISTTELNYVDGVTSSIQTQLNDKAPLASPALTGTPTAPTATSGTNTTQIATTAFVSNAISLIDISTTLDDLTDVSVASPTSGQFLKWDGSAWVASNMGVSVSSTAPTSPTQGQIWFYQDTAQTFLYYGTVWIEIGGSSGDAQVQVSSSAPSNPVEGGLWFDSDTSQTFVYYNTAWVEIGLASFDAKGDLLVGTGDNTATKLVAGSNNQVLTVDSSTASGLKWSTPTEYASTGKAIAMAIVFGG